MIETDTYLSIEGPALGIYKDKGSKFNAYVFPIQNEGSFKDQLQLIKAQEANARHHCWAFILGEQGEYSKSNDDGEPGNTAGAPILRSLLKSKTTHVGCVVARYFGGTKLGVPGLIAAYGGSAEEAVKNAIITKHVIREKLELTFEYPHISFVERVIKFHDIDVIKREQKENVIYHLLVRRSKLKKVIEHVQENYNVTIRSV